MNDGNVRLNEYDKDEWYAVARYLLPYLTEEEYAVMWEDFVKMKTEHLRKQELN